MSQPGGKHLKQTLGIEFPALGPFGLILQNFSEQYPQKHPEYLQPPKPPYTFLQRLIHELANGGDDTI
jgi:hypothetical protein